MPHKNHKLGMKHLSGTGKSRTLKERQRQIVKQLAKRYGVTEGSIRFSLNFNCY